MIFKYYGVIRLLQTLKFSRNKGIKSKVNSKLIKTGSYFKTKGCGQVVNHFNTILFIIINVSHAFI